MHSSNTCEVAAPPSTPSPTDPRPLLPEFLLRPWSLVWLWLAPVGVLLALNFQGYQLIEGTMDAAQRRLAHEVGWAGAINLAAGLVVLVGSALAARRRSGSRVGLGWAVAAILVQTAYLWVAAKAMDPMLPTSVRSWLYPDTQYLFNQFAFALLPLFWGILRLAATTPRAGFRPALALGVGFSLGAPLVLYLAVTLLARVTRLWQAPAVVVAAGIVLLGLLMFIGLARVVLLGLRAGQALGPRAERLAILLIGLVFPLCGLLLNRAIPFPTDLQAWEIYALVVANTGILLLASWKNRSWPRGRLYLLCATLPFSLYFFLVFLPYTPLSILGVIVMGTGFLVLSPVLLFVMHLHLLNEARCSLPATSGGFSTAAACLGCFLLLPGFFAARAGADRVSLHRALDYTFAPALETGAHRYSGNRLELRRALANHRKYKNGIFYPLLSSFYSWVVFDNLVLPDDKLGALETAFFGQPGGTERADPTQSRWSAAGRSSVRDRTRMPARVALPRTVVLRDLAVAPKSPSRDSAEVTLTFTLENTGATPAEFVQELPLPAGVFVSGFRLHIDGVAVPGRVVEKKTALWVYTMIRDGERRDPGLLFYNRPDALELRVFPVVAGKPSVVEIDFLAPGAAPDVSALAPLKDPAAVLHALGRTLSPTVLATPRGQAVFAPAALAQLPPVARAPYLHLIVDRSAEGALEQDLAPVIDDLQAAFPEARLGRLSLANYDVVEPVSELTPLAELRRFSRRAEDRALPVQGGLLLERALASGLRAHRDRDLQTAGDPPPPRPIFILIGKNAPASFPGSELIAAWSSLVPQLEVYHWSGQRGAPTRLSPSGAAAPAPLLRCGGVLRPRPDDQPVLFPGTHAEDSVEYFDPATDAWQTLDGLRTEGGSGRWAGAVALQLAAQSYAESPGDARPAWKDLVQSSRQTGILLPVTSYIVVENSAQWRMLEQSERRKLGQNAALAFRETPATPWVWVAAGFGAWLALRRWRLRGRPA